MANTDISNLLHVYSLYIDRIKHEGNLTWTRFKIFLTINSGALGIILLLFNPNFKGSLNSPEISLFVFTISIIGILISILWSQIIKSGQYWQDLMNEVLVDIEKSINIDEVKLYREITKKGKEMKKGSISASNKLANMFVIVWSLILVVDIVWFFRIY